MLEVTDSEDNSIVSFEKINEWLEKTDNAGKELGDSVNVMLLKKYENRSCHRANHVNVSLAVLLLLGLLLISSNIYRARFIEHFRAKITNRPNPLEWRWKAQ